MDLKPSDINSIVDGQYVDTSSRETQNAKKNNNTLGKEAFLQLLVTQMKYQDPLNPTDDTDFIAQLAQFSSLEQLQNLNQSFSDTSALNMVGKTATVSTVDSTGHERTVTGVVDYVTRSGSKMKVCINGNLYDAEDVVSVYDDYYVISQKLPTVEAQAAQFSHDDPKDIVVSLTLGEDEYEASSVAVLIGDMTVDSKYLRYNDGKLTIDKEALKGLDAGVYSVAFVFGNQVYTTITDKVTLEVKGIAEKVEDPSEDAPSGDDDSVGEDPAEDDSAKKEVDS